MYYIPRCISENRLQKLLHMIVITRIVIRKEMLSNAIPISVKISIFNIRIYQKLFVIKVCLLSTLFRKAFLTHHGEERHLLMLFFHRTACIKHEVELQTLVWIQMNTLRTYEPNFTHILGQVRSHWRRKLGLVLVFSHQRQTSGSGTIVNSILTRTIKQNSSNFSWRFFFQVFHYVLPLHARDTTKRQPLAESDLSLTESDLECTYNVLACSHIGNHLFFVFKNSSRYSESLRRCSGKFSISDLFRSTVEVIS